eukprot:s1394_g8.t1
MFDYPTMKEVSNRIVELSLLMCTLQPECKMCGLINTKFVHQALFPMYVIKVSDFLEMTGKPERMQW